MGLDLTCNDLDVKCGSYERVQEVRYLLLCAVKDYVKNRHSDNDNLINYLQSLLDKKMEINYEKYNEEYQKKLNDLNIGGFTSFIWHSDSDGYLSPYQANKFMQTWNIIKNFADEELKYGQDFYLDDIFTESIESGKDIIFW